MMNNTTTTEARFIPMMSDGRCEICGRTKTINDRGMCRACWAGDIGALDVLMKRVRADEFPLSIQTCSDGGWAAMVGEYGSGLKSHATPGGALLAAWHNAKEAVAA